MGHVFALGLHAGPLREAIHHLKYEGQPDLGLLLGRRLGEAIPPHYDAIIPIPLHPRRLRERGYNQAAMVAAGIAERTGAPVVEGRLVRLRHTDRQADLDRAGRFRNLQGAFGFRTSRAAWLLGSGTACRLDGQSILLVDDVLTTGATATAAATVLRAAGAGRVDLAVLAVSTVPVPLP